MTTYKFTPPYCDEPVPVKVDTNDNRFFEVCFEERCSQWEFHWENDDGGWARNPQTGMLHKFYIYVVEENIHLWLDGYLWHIERETPQAKRRQGATGEKEVGDITAPMPGNVLKILVNQGDTVEPNQPLVIMESMKMEMTLSAPAKAWVSEITCEPGQLVEMNTVLVKMEAVKDEPVLS